MKHPQITRSNLHVARKVWGRLPHAAISALKEITEKYELSVASGDLCYLDGRWYVSHTGLLRLAQHNRCSGINVQPVRQFCNPEAGRWAFRATVYKTRNCRGFVGYGDADPSNVSPLVRGAEMRVAETRAVNRALRKAYGIGLCSVEELGTRSETRESSGNLEKLPPEPANGNSRRLYPKVRDRLCQLIRQHQLDPALVKLYAAEFCGVQELRAASRELVEDFVKHLSELAANDRDALLCKLSGLAPKQEGVA